MSTSGIFNKTEEYKHVEQDAKQILSMAGIFAPPVPVDIIKKVLKPIPVTIDIVPFSEEALGISYADADENAWRILIHPNQPLTAQRFTAFHEFYHILQGNPGFYKDTIEGSFEESKANYFAACIMMPARWVRIYWERCKDVATLARIFNVSVTAMEIRLQGLEHYLAA